MAFEAAETVASAFDLGSLRAAPTFAAAGWASHNIVWRFDTDTGVWAVKQIGRESGPALQAAIDIEAAAHDAGIPCPTPTRSGEGAWLAVIDDSLYRCHEWIDGHCPTASLTAHDAQQAGRALGTLHRLDLPWTATVPRPAYCWGAAHWQSLAQRAADLQLDWSRSLLHSLTDIYAVERQAARWAEQDHRWVTSHRDVRPDNTLRRGQDLLLVDWDAAGPAIAGREVATLLRWWAPHQAALLTGYCSVAGDVDLLEGAGEGGGLIWWLELNVRLALDQPTNQQRQTSLQALIEDLFQR